MTIAIIGDPHLGKISADQIKKDKIAESQKLFFEYLRSFCSDNDIKELIWTGDIFDNNRNVDSSVIQYGVGLFHDMFGDCTHHVILGNHCLYERGNLKITSLTCIQHLPNVNLYKKPTKVKLLNHNFLFTPYLVPSLFTKFSNNIESLGKNNDVIVGHFDIIGATTENGRNSTVGLDMNKLLNNVHLTISGHYHNVSKYVRGENKIQYVGSPYQLTFGDAEQTRGFWTINEHLKLNFYENKVSYKFVHLDNESILKYDTLNNYFIECSYPSNLNEDEHFKLNKLIEQKTPISFRTIPKDITSIDDICSTTSEDEQEIANEMSEAINIGDMLKVCEVYEEAVPPKNKKIVDKLLLDIRNKVKDKTK